MIPIDQILNRFPKQRPALPPAQHSIYEKEYLSNREGKNLISSFAQKLESWMHQKVTDYVTGERFLELGAGTLNQVPYLQHQKKAFYDVVEPGKFLYQDSQYKDHIRYFFDDIEECNDIYDAIFLIAVLEHVENLPAVLAKMGLLISEDGVCVNAIPSEGGFLWGMSWRLSTGLSYKLRTGFSYGTLMRHEHVNDHDEIIALHKYFFDKVELVYFPVSHKHLSFYCCITARHPKLDLCRLYFKTTQSTP